MKLIAILIFSMCFSAFAEVKIGYVDLQKAVQLTKSGKSAKSTLEGDFNKRKKKLEKTELDLKKMSEDLKKQQSVLSQNVFQQKQADLQREMLKYREEVGKNQMEISKRERELMAPILEKMKKVIEKVAKTGEYGMILERGENSVIWAAKQYDITQKVVSEFDKMK